MSKSLASVRQKMKPEVLAAAEKKAKKMLAVMPLQELRHARELSQEQLAHILHVQQASISKLERRTDMYISTLRNVIRAMGGELEIRALFPEGVVTIDQFQNLSEACA